MIGAMLCIIKQWKPHIVNFVVPTCFKVRNSWSRIARKPVFGFPTRSDTNRFVQLQEMDRLKLEISD